MCCKSEQSNNCFDKIFLVRIWKFTPVLVWLKALVRIHNLIQECLMFWFFWSDETHGDAEILGMQIWNFRYANMDFFKTPHIQIWFLGKDPVFKFEFLVLFSHPWFFNNCIKKNQSKICNIIFWKGGGVRRPFGIFPKIHPILWHNPSLRVGGLECHYSSFTKLDNLTYFHRRY